MIPALLKSKIVISNPIGFLINIGLVMNFWVTYSPQYFYPSQAWSLKQS
jgi:hypothetical protein